MKRLFLAGLLAMASLAVLPESGMAQANHPYSDHGYGWFGGKVFRHMLWIHSDGPLYNYGPYIPGQQGYTTMHIPQPYHGSYIPANTSLYNGGAGYGSYANFGNVPVAPQQYATQQPQPVAVAPEAPSPAQQLGVAQPAPVRSRLFDRSRVVPASYTSVYPSWLTGR